MLGETLGEYLLLERLGEMLREYLLLEYLYPLREMLREEER